MSLPINDLYLPICHVPDLHRSEILPIMSSALDCPWYWTDLQYNRENYGRRTICYSCVCTSGTR